MGELLEGLDWRQSGSLVLKNMDIDPVITFGKHKGMKLSQLETGYLVWMSQQVGGGIENGPWKSLALAELERRKTGRALVKIRVADAWMDEGKVSLEGLAQSGYLEGGTLPVKTYAVTWEAVDCASLGLLKEFVLRTDKSQNLTSWLRGLAEEVIRHGCLKDSGNETSTYQYIGVLFEFEVNVAARTFKLVRTTRDKLVAVSVVQVESGSGEKGVEGGVD